MLRNIRRFYWKQRDRGQGRKTVMAVLVFFLFVAIIVAAIIKSMMGGHHAGLQTVHKTNTATGAAVVTETASGASVAVTETAPDRELPQETKETISVDTTNLSTFLGFMSDTAYEDLKNQLIQICQDRKCRSVKKLTYQQTKAFDVTSFVLLSDGSVYQCNCPCKIHIRKKCRAKKLQLHLRWYRSLIYFPRHPCMCRKMDFSSKHRLPVSSCHSMRTRQLQKSLYR